VKIVVAGGTGFLGRALTGSLLDAGHQVLLLTRRNTTPGSRVDSVAWSPDGTTGPWASACEGADAFVNLAGEPIAGRRWSLAQRERIRSSRILATRSLVSAIASLQRPPAAFVSASGVGYYGTTRGDDVLTEADPPGFDFIASVCKDWEAEAARAEGPATRVVFLRTGMVLEKDGGALAKMLPAFRLMLGGRIGPGNQFVSWIHRRDWVGLVRWAIEREVVVGPLNATAPNPATNAELARTIGNVLGRPSWLPVPATFVRLALGEMADALLLAGQRAIPTRPLGLGFAFRHPDLREALDSILRRT
jgi:uncharacterized protein